MPHKPSKGTTMPLNPPKRIGKMDKAMVMEYVTDPKLTKTKAWQKTHNSTTTNVTSLHQQAAHAFRNPLVKMELAKYNERVEDVLSNTVDEWGNENNTRKREIAVDTAKYIHDKIHGRAKQSIDIQTTSISLSLDLSGQGLPLLDARTGSMTGVPPKDDTESTKDN